MNLRRMIFHWILGKSLHEAAQSGDIARVRALLVAEPAMVNAPDARGMTPLQLAARHGHLPIVEVLIAAGADVRQAHAVSGLTPLHLAAGHGHQLLTRYLLAQGADLRARDRYGQTPLMLAQQRRKVGAAEILQQHMPVD